MTVPLVPELVPTVTYPNIIWNLKKKKKNLEPNKPAKLNAFNPYPFSNLRFNNIAYNNDPNTSFSAAIKSVSVFFFFFVKISPAI